MSHDCKPTATRASRRQFLAAGGAGTVGAALAIPAFVGPSTPAARSGLGAPSGGHGGSSHSMGGLGTIGDVSPDEYFDPTAFLTTWNQAAVPRGEGDFYRETVRSDGSRLREYRFVAVDREIEIAPGLYFPAWTFNGQVPGPTIRATEGDTIRIRFLNQGSHAHTIHFHGWHTHEMDGSFPNQFVEPGQEFLYEFDADPVGLHLYHCHSVPLKRHIHKGLYGVFIVDPRPDRYEGKLQEIAKTRNPDHPENRAVRELIMMMNAFDTDFDADNEIYAVNTVGFHYMRHPIPVRVGQLVRVYLVNITEFDPVNSLHLHAGFFEVFRTGTKLETMEHTDTVMLCQAERAILEFKLRWPGQYMFHAHQSEFAELGWMGVFDAVESEAELAALERRPVYAAPDFALADSSGRMVRLSDFRDRANVVLVFSLGSGCTHCSEQLRGLAGRAAEFRSQASEIVVVTPDAEPSGTPRLHVTADPEAQAAPLFGMSPNNRSRSHGTFLIDRAGRVRWQTVGEQPFMDNDRLLAELAKLNA
jgi:FtsP/CotA-like multicopper oxidase with cupredoxin domain/peroxiredoxin